MPFTSEDLEEIKKAIGSGALTVKFADKTVTYRSMPEMIQAKNYIEQELGVQPNQLFRTVMRPWKGIRRNLFGWRIDQG